MRDLPVDTALAQLQNLKAELRASRLRTLVALLVASYLAFNWSELYLDFSRGGSLVALPVLINGFAWMAWAASSLFAFRREARAREVDSPGTREYTFEETPSHAIYTELDFLTYVSRRERTFSFQVEALVALQFIVMALLLGANRIFLF